MGPLDFIETDFEPDYRTLDVEGGELAWWEDGGGAETIVWVHGLPLESRAWEPQRRFFASRCRNVFVDLRGYGRSTKLPHGPKDVTALYSADLSALFETLSLDGAMLVGHASAGHLSLRFAARNPDKIGKLVSINGSPRFRAGPDWPWGFSDADMARFETIRRERGIEGLTDAVLDPGNVFRDLSPKDAERLTAWFRPMSLTAGAETLMGFFDSISFDDDRELMSRIAAPTLLISGTIGREVPSDVSLFLRREIPGSKLVELPGVDHFSFATRPDLVNGLIDDMRRT